MGDRRRPDDDDAGVAWHRRRIDDDTRERGLRHIAELREVLARYGRRDADDDDEKGDG